MHYMKTSEVETEAIRCCPMATKPSDPVGTIGPSGLGRVDAGVTGGRYRAWGKTKPLLVHGVAEGYYHGSYSMNSWVSVPDEKARLIIGGGPAKFFWKTADIAHAAQIPVYLDSWWWCAWPRDTDAPPQHEDDRTNFPCGCRNSIHRFCIDRHDGCINAVFLDNSVRRVGLKELWTLQWHRNYRTTGSWTKAGGAEPSDWPQWMRKFKDY